MDQNTLNELCTFTWGTSTRNFDVLDDFFWPPDDKVDFHTLNFTFEPGSDTGGDYISAGFSFPKFVYEPAWGQGPFHSRTLVVNNHADNAPVHLKGTFSNFVTHFRLELTNVILELSLSDDSLWYPDFDRFIECTLCEIRVLPPRTRMEILTTALQPMFLNASNGAVSVSANLGSATGICLRGYSVFFDGSAYSQVDMRDLFAPQTNGLVGVFS
jgi:hypothetical protein